MPRFIAATLVGAVFVLMTAPSNFADDGKDDGKKDTAIERDAGKISAHKNSASKNRQDQPVDRDALHALYTSHIFESADAKSEGDGAIPYRMLAPEVIEPGKQYPLVLFLHGAGERGDDNAVQLKHAAHEFARADRRQQYPAFVIFPQCPKEKRWVESDWNLKSGRGEFPIEPSTSMQLALELVDQISEKQPVDKKRRYVTGLSMGGQGAWFAAAQGDRFAAMLEVCGGGDPEFVAQYAGKPIWAFHGQADNVVPVERGREMIVALTQAGHAPELRYVEYPSVKHDSWTRTFARDDVYHWIFSQSQR